MRVAVIGCLLAATLALAAAAEPATATENFEEADLNHDGAVSLDEFKKYMSADHPANKAFVYFGVQLLREAPTLNAGVSAEFEEAEEEVDQAEESMVTPKSKPEAGGTAVAMAADGSGAAVEDVEGGSGGLTSRGTGSNAGESNAGDVAPAAAAHPKAFTKVITTVFSVIFLAEWGDRSQIATIALAAAKDPVGVCVGGVLGHAVSTAIAVIGGRLLATRISERTVAYVGGTLFLLFAVHSFIVGPPGGDEGESFFSFFAPAPKEATLTGMTATGGDKLL